MEPVITMNAFFSTEFYWLGIYTFLTGLALHLVIWRVFPRWRSIPLLFMTVLVSPLALFTLFPLESPLWVAPVILHLIFAANYIAIYPAFQASSPTIEILFCLHHRGAQSSEAIVSSMDPKSLVGSRVDDLKSGSLISQDLKMSASAKLIAKVFIAYRRLLGLAEGQG